MKEGDSIRGHLVVFEDLIRQHKLAGEELAETVSIVTLFGTVPEAYDPLITVLENLGDGDLKFDSVILYELKIRGEWIVASLACSSHAIACKTGVKQRDGR